MTTALLTKKEVDNLSKEEKRNFYLYNPQCYVKARSQEKVFSICTEIITKAVLYKGLQKSEAEIVLISNLFYEDIKKKYSYVSIWKIAEVLQDSKYGEGFNVSVKGLIDVLDTHLYEVNKANKLRAIELERESSTPLLSDNRTEEEKQLAIVQKAYESYLINGFIFDFNNEIFQFILENGMYDWSDEEIQRAEAIAKSRAKEIADKKLSKARMTLDNKEAQSLSEILKTDIRKYDNFGSINKTELVKLFFKRMKEQNIEKITLETE